MTLVTSTRRCSTARRVGVPSATHRLRWMALETVRHQKRCSVCQAEPIVTLDDEHEPTLRCRMHREATLEDRK